AYEATVLPTELPRKFGFRHPVNTAISRPLPRDGEHRTRSIYLFFPSAARGVFQADVGSRPAGRRTLSYSALPVSLCRAATKIRVATATARLSVRSGQIRGPRLWMRPTPL